MRVIEPYAELLVPASQEDGISALRFIERMARISHRSEDAQTSDSWQRFLTSVVLEHGDWSVTEHSAATVIFRVDRGITHELVRHRHFSVTQESTRFVNGSKKYPEGLEFIRPDRMCEADQTLNFDFSFSVWSAAMGDAEHRYKTLLVRGIRPQEARSVLPNALASTIAVTGNFRAWRHLLLMRTTKETHPDFRKVAIPLLHDFKTRVPLLFDDINAEARQIDNMRLPQ